MRIVSCPFTTAKMNNIEPLAYLTDVLKAAHHGFSDRCVVNDDPAACDILHL